jgi:hypothetical protein
MSKTPGHVISIKALKAMEADLILCEVSKVLRELPLQGDLWLVLAGNKTKIADGGAGPKWRDN